MLERFMDVPDTAVLGTSAYASLIKEIYTYRGHFPPSSRNGCNVLQVYTSAGRLDITMLNSVAPDHVSVGTIQLETMKLLNTVDKLVFNPSYVTGYFTGI